MSTTIKRHSGRVSGVGFALIILVIVALGLGGVMIVTTSIGAQSRELTALREQANELEYESSDLRSRLESLSSTGSLALRASELDMVPNPYPVFVMLGSGEIIGEPTQVEGDEFPELRGQVSTPTPSPSPTPVATPSATPPAPAEQSAEPAPDDVVAASQPTQQPTQLATQQGGQE